MALKLTFKICIVGDPGVGKTSLIIRYIENKFHDNYTPTLGVDFLTKKLVVGLQKTSVNLIIWDIGGEEKWRQKLNLYLNGADGVLIIYDVTRMSTFKKIDFWINAVTKHAGQIPYVLVGNKVDLEDIRQVTPEIAEDHLKNKEIPLIETSAKTGKTVNEMFHNIAEKIIIQKTKKKAI